MVNFRLKGRTTSQKTARRSALSYYHSAQPAPKSPFQKNARAKNKKPRLLGRLAYWLVIIVILAGFGYSLALRPEPELILSSTAYRSPETYREASVSALKDFQNRNKLTFDEKTLSGALKSKFPEVSSVSVDLPLFGLTPTIHLDIAGPSLVYRGAEGTFGGAERLIIDAKGTVIGPLSEFPSTKDLPLITDESGFEARAGRPILSLSDINFILIVVAQAKKAKVPIASLTLPKQAQELDLRTSDHSYFVKFYLRGDALTQAGQFLAARKQFDEAKKQPSQYIDVRISGKIYYK